jgi:uncharacterized protein (DUF849 family)
VRAYLEVMAKTGTKPEFECFDLGIVRCVAMSGTACTGSAAVQLRHGRRLACRPILTSSHPAPIVEGSPWQVTAIGRASIWPLHARAAELGGHLRTGLEDTFYLPDGKKARSNGELVAALARCARDAGRQIATPDEARKILALRPQPAIK